MSTNFGPAHLGFWAAMLGVYPKLGQMKGGSPSAAVATPKAEVATTTCVNPNRPQGDVTNSLDT